jgi:hypothetical protein
MKKPWLTGWMSWAPAAILLGQLLLYLPATAGAEGGEFFREFWFKASGNRFRVNSPDTATGPYRDRPEAKQTGRMAIAVDDNLSQVGRADLYLELWGGHPGVADKRFTLNGKSTYAMPEVGSAASHCTYSYPTIPLKLDELVRGENALQFTCDKGETFWGHYIVRAACVRLALRGTHPTLAQAGLAGFAARIRAVPCQAETLMLTLECPDEMRDKIASVEFQGRYDGYDENGNREGNDWHGFTKDGAPAGLIAVADMPPFDAVFWDLSMVPDQKNMAVRAVVRFKKPADLAYVTPEAVGLGTPARKARVRLFGAADLPRPFWSREDKKRTCTVQLDADPARIERAQLHIAVWDGGRGKVPAPLSLNGAALAVPNWVGDHSLIYSRLDVAPSLLKRGANEVLVHSDTEHHGIEVCLPGPALVVRLKK